MRKELDFNSRLHPVDPADPVILSKTAVLGYFLCLTVMFVLLGRPWARSQ